jgi:DNA-binding NarL/FixJ family response regulator
LVIEGEQSVRDALATGLGAHPDFNVLVAESGAAGLARAQETRPDVALVDAVLGNEDGGHRLVRDLKRESPATNVIVMDVLPVQDDVTAFGRAGANAFIIKDAPIENFAKMIRSISAASRDVPAARMTKREREITDLVAQGMSNKAIAGALTITVYTVKSHVHNILQKLALDTRFAIADHIRRTDSPDTDARAHHP